MLKKKTLETALQELKARHRKYIQDPSEANKKAWVKTWNESSPMVMDALLVDPAFKDVVPLVSEFLKKIKEGGSEQDINLLKDHIVERNNEWISEMHKKLDRLDTMAEAAEKALGIVGSVLKIFIAFMRKDIKERIEGVKIVDRTLGEYPPSLLQGLGEHSASVKFDQEKSARIEFEHDGESNKSPGP